MSKSITLLFLLGIVYVEASPFKQGITENTAMPIDLTTQTINTGLSFNFCSWQANVNQVLSNFSNTDKIILESILLQIQSEVVQLKYSIDKDLVDTMLASPDAAIFMEILQIIDYNVTIYIPSSLWDLCNITNQFNSLVSKLSVDNQPAVNMFMNKFISMAEYFMPYILNHVYSVNYEAFYNLIYNNNAGMNALADLFSFSSDRVLWFNPCDWETSLKSVLSDLPESEQTLLNEILLQIQSEIGVQIQSWNDQQYLMNKDLIDAILNTTDANVFMQLGQLIGNNITNPEAAPLWNLCSMTSQFYGLVQQLSPKYQPAAFICMNTFFSIIHQNILPILNSVYEKNIATFNSLMNSNPAVMIALGKLINRNEDPTTMVTNRPIDLTSLTQKPYNKSTTQKPITTTTSKKPTTTSKKPTTTTKKPTTTTKKPTTTTKKPITSTTTKKPITTTTTEKPITTTTTKKPTTTTKKPLTTTTTKKPLTTTTTKKPITTTTTEKPVTTTTTKKPLTTLFKACTSNPCQNGGQCQLASTGYDCGCINGYYGLTCEHKILNSTIFKNSTILTQEQSQQLLDLSGFPLNSNWTLLYQATKDGFSSESFHSKCNGILDTLIVIQSSSSNIFGGYTQADWSGSWYKSDANAFLFSLINTYNTSYKMPIKPQYADYAIFARSDYGPTFGLCFDSYINKYGSYGSYDCSGATLYTYQFPSFSSPSNFLGGSYDVIAIEIEVFQKIIHTSDTTTNSP